MEPENQAEFEDAVLRLAEGLRQFNDVPYSDSTPSKRYAELIQIADALTLALQVIAPLNLQHRKGQDISVESFNWPLALELKDAKSVQDFERGMNAIESENHLGSYPTSVIQSIFDLRDVARSAASQIKPKRGNQALRTSRSRQIDEVGKMFVFRFRAYFGHMPPITKDGWVVNLLGRALIIAGIDGADPAEVLRRYVEKDAVGLALLPTAREAARARKRPK